MPEYWYDKRTARKIHEMENTETSKLNLDIVANRKPYFMTYIYPDLRKKNKEYNLKCHYGSILKWSDKNIHSIDEFLNCRKKSERMKESSNTHEYKVGFNKCIVNRMSDIFEDEFDGVKSKRFSKAEFDYNILKSNVEYSRHAYEAVLKEYIAYKNNLKSFNNDPDKYRLDEFQVAYIKKNFINTFKMNCEIICTNEKELCDILIDICYSVESSKQFAWDICGEVIIDNLIEHCGNKLAYPVRVDDGGEFTYSGNSYVMKELSLEVEQ